MMADYTKPRSVESNTDILNSCFDENDSSLKRYFKFWKAVITPRSGLSKDLRIVWLAFHTLPVGYVLTSPYMFRIPSLLAGGP